jgi:hypothetical protein
LGEDVSLLRPAIRSCAVAALKDRTWAEQRVFDSDMTALAEAVYGTVPKPYICVYTDTDDHTTVTGAELYEGDRRVLNLVVEIGVANAIEGKNQNLILQFAATDQGMELAVDMVAKQVTDALWGDPKSQWGEILKKLAYRILRAPSRRGGQAQGGIRFAARRITYVLNTLYEIPPGMVPASDHPLMQFINMAKGNPVFGATDVGKILEQMLDTTQAPDWRVAQAYLGMTEDSAVATQLPGVPLVVTGNTVVTSPFEQSPIDMSDLDEYAPPLTDIELADETTPPTWPPINLPLDTEDDADGNQG